MDRYLPPFDPRQVLDPDAPVSIGAMVGPEAFTEVRYLAHHKQLRALERIPELSARFQEAFGRPCGGLLREYRTRGRRDHRGRAGVGKWNRPGGGG